MINILRLVKSFSYAFRGLKRTFQEEQNLKLQSLLAVVVLFFAFILGLNRLEVSFLIFLIGLVILMEFANSAVERVADLLKPRMDSYVKEIKDIMAAAVLIAGLVSVISGILIFWPYIFS